MKVIILAGGKGSRLYEETLGRPKPMVEVGGRPLLWHIMKIYASQGFSDFVVCVGHKGEVVRDYFRNYHFHHQDFTIDLATNHLELHDGDGREDWRVTVAETGIETQTGGRLLRVRRYLGDDTFMLTYGDGVSDLNVGELLKYHRQCRKIATVTAVRHASHFGEIRIEGDLAMAFDEKPPAAEGWINGGFFVFEPAIFSNLSGDQCILEQEPLRRLAEEGQLAAHKHAGYWKHMDTYQDVQELNRDWETSAPWKTWP